MSELIVQHTEGPWDLEILENGDINIWDANDDCYLAEIMSDAINGNSPSKEIALANARLMKEAPEMLKELKAIGHQVQVDTGHFNRIQRLIERIEGL